jgi:hypothetical protein
MKKIFIVLAVTVATLTSCKKTYVCECVTTKPNMDGAWIDEYETKQRNLEDAQEWCSSSDYESIPQTQECNIIQ